MAESTPRPVPVLRPGEPFSPYKRFTGSFLPEPLERQAGVSDIAQRVWARLARYAGESCEAWPALPTLAKALGRSPKTVQRAIRELEKHGLILTVRRRGRANVYRLVWHGIFDGSARIDEPAEVIAINQPRQMRLPLAGAIDPDGDPTPVNGDLGTPVRSDPPPRSTVTWVPRSTVTDEESQEREPREESPPTTQNAASNEGAKQKENPPRPRSRGQRLVRRGSLILPVPKGREPEPEFDAQEQIRLFREQGLEQLARQLEAEIAAEQRQKEIQAPCP